MKTKFFTGEGDSGESSVGDKKISKSSALAEFLGSLDELNSWIGLCRVKAEEKKLYNDTSKTLREIQESLFILQAEVAGIGFQYEKHPQLQEEKIKELEKVIEAIDLVLPKLEKFIIVGGVELSAHLDVARTIARRTERFAKRYSDESFDSTQDKSELPKPLLQYLNRLSSVLFALARHVNFQAGIKEEHPKY